MKKKANLTRVNIGDRIGIAYANKQDLKHLQKCKPVIKPFSVKSLIIF